MASLNSVIDNILVCLPGDAEIPEAILLNLAGYLGDDGEPIGVPGARELIESRRESAANLAKRVQADNANAARKAALAAFGAEVRNVEVPDALRPLLAKATELDAKVFVVVEDDGVFFTVNAPRASNGGGRKGGRIADDAPSGYLDSEGDRILGPLTKWAKENFSEEELREMGCYTPQSGKFRSGSALAKKLTQAGKVSEDPNPEGVEETEEAEASA